MQVRSSTEHPRARPLVHPGPFDPVRIQSRHADSARHVRLSLAPGARLFDAIVEPLAALDIHNASTTILGGAFERVVYCVTERDTTGQAVIVYSAPIDAGRAWLVFGNATLGRNQHGAPIVHCHGCFRSETGEVKGGHIITQDCIVGPTPVSVLVTSLDRFELRVAFDPETNIPLLKPHALEAEVDHA